MCKKWQSWISTTLKHKLLANKVNYLSDHWSERAKKHQVYVVRTKNFWNIFVYYEFLIYNFLYAFPLAVPKTAKYSSDDFGVCVCTLIWPNANWQP